MNTIERHLKYIEKNVKNYVKIELGKEQNYSVIIVIPVISEYGNLEKILNSLMRNNPSYFDKVLILFVVNNLPDSPDWIKKDNQKTMELIRGIIRKDNRSDDLGGRVILSGLNIGLIDSSSEGKELSVKDGGVGVARKLGMDSALRLFDFKRGTKKNYIVCLDADCKVKDNYLEVLFSRTGNADARPAVISFEHSFTENSQEREAIVYYEMFLRYYVLSLFYAGSPYAYHSIGSTMVCDALSYMAIGGMNKRKAGEDFYFLQKLAKSRGIDLIYETTVYPAGRSSWRVPFGTGKSISNSISGIDLKVTYDFEIIKILKNWLNFFLFETGTPIAKILEKAHKLHPGLHEFLLENSVEESLSAIKRNSKSEEQYIRQKKIWFDGFKTFKFIKGMSKNYFPEKNILEMVDQLLTEFKVLYKNKVDSLYKPGRYKPEDYLDILKKLEKELLNRRVRMS